jgi:hypothetical protein
MESSIIGIYLAIKMDQAQETKDVKDIPYLQNITSAWGM